MTKPKKTTSPFSPAAFFQTFKQRYKAGWGIWALLGTLLAVSFLAAANFETAPKIYIAGEIADNDVMADRDLQVMDREATEAKKSQLSSMQPPVYDLSMEPFEQFKKRIGDIFNALHHPNSAHNPAIERLTEEIGNSVADEILPQLAQPAVQDYIMKTLMPAIQQQMEEGLVWDMRVGRIGGSGVLIHNLDSDTETLKPNIHSLQDVQSFLTEISIKTRQETKLNAQSRRAINILLSATVPASMTMNQEASKKRSADVISNISPVVYQIQKGEVIVRRGERVSEVQQLKLQSLYNSVADPIRWHIVAGSFLCALLFASGFFITPSGRPGRPLLLKDLLLISFILLFFGICAKGVYLFGLRMDSVSLQNSFAIAFPVPGAVGLVAMVFAARRYCTMGLLLSFFCMLMFKGGYQLFIYYFLGGMLATWLVTRAQNRQDVVWSAVPLIAGLLCIWCGTAFLKNSPMFEVPMLITSTIICALLSLIILFALSPLLEMLFSYSTRFRLMELMSLEQPLMQEIMVTIPGTYHHSLVVANMVEAGAKAIGANSLLCKVAALYHDAGKLSYPEYFIENQFGAPNRHDKLAPSMSALILLSHVKKGTELAEKYKLGQEIIDIIRQHHGTRLMKFFYQKAIDQGEKPQEAEYSYPGPRPQSKEAAILMLADSVEASSRTLADPTPARIRSHIDKIMKGIFAEGQLDESELTFKDLNFLSENFQRILTGIFHQRIAYPEKKIKDAQENKSQTNGTAKSAADTPAQPVSPRASEIVRDAPVSDISGTRNEKSAFINDNKPIAMP